MRARVLVQAQPQQVFDFLSDLDNHWGLTGSSVERIDSDRQGSTVRMNGPLGIRRTAHTRVIEAQPPRLMVGTAELGSGARGTVRWSLEPSHDATRVELSATVDAAGARDRLLLTLGGRAWFQRCFEHALERLAALFAERS